MRLLGVNRPRQVIPHLDGQLLVVDLVIRGLRAGLVADGQSLCGVKLGQQFGAWFFVLARLTSPLGTPAALRLPTLWPAGRGAGDGIAEARRASELRGPPAFSAAAKRQKLPPLDVFGLLPFAEYITEP